MINLRTEVVAWFIINIRSDYSTPPMEVETEFDKLEDIMLAFRLIPKHLYLSR